MSKKFTISILSVTLLTLFLGDGSAMFAQRPGMLSMPPERGTLTLPTREEGEEPSVTDSVAVNDSIAPRSQSAIDSRIDFDAKDSIFFDMRINRVFLYEEAEVNYQSIDLTAGRIEMDFIKQEVSAFPKFDSLGRESQVPHFDDKKQVFQAKEMVYNFQTKKARIKNIVMQEGEMLIHGQIVKKLPNDEAFVQHARFTTCDLEHPHFHITALRAKIIPDDKVVTGGAMLFLNNVPTPIALPFGLFPNTTKQASGVIIPSYGESPNQGFFLREGGFNWGINDYVDWRITGDIYTRGEWSLRNAFQYAKRYKFSGNFNVENGVVPQGERETPNYSQTRKLRVSWTHSQDPKANQNSSFSANVNYFNSASQSLSSNISDHLNNQSNSSIAYQLRIANRFNVSTTANLNYNITSGNINATFPTINFSMNPIYPFQRKVRRGEKKWYESFKLNYSMNATNQITGVDSTFWTPDILKTMRNGIRHNVPMDVNIKLMQGKINWNHAVQFSEQSHFKAVKRGTQIDSIYNSADEFIRLDTIYGATISEEYGFWGTRDYSYTTSFSTTLYGMLQFRRGFFRAFRHVMTPSFGFTFAPDFNTYNNGFRFYERNRNGDLVEYNIFDGSAFRPSGARKRGSINFSLGNNFEMKVRDRKDTINGTRKLKLLDRLNLSTSYNIAADSLNWAPISVSAQTRLFGNLNIVANASFSLYARDSVTNRQYNKFIWQTSDKFLLRESTNMSTGFSWSLKSKDSDDKGERSLPLENMAIFEQPSAFDLKWSLNINYTIGYRSTYNPRDNYMVNIWGYPVDEPFFSEYNRNIMQTLSFNGSINLTDKWRISYNSGFDFLSKKLSHTSFSINRDLHCWTMDFTWTPFGMYKEWSFSIRLMSNMLGDALKYDRRKSFRDDDYH